MVGMIAEAARGRWRWSYGVWGPEGRSAADAGIESGLSAAIGGGSFLLSSYRVKVCLGAQAVET